MGIKKTYKASRRGLIHYVLLGFIILPVLLFILEDKSINEKLLFYFPILIPMLLLLWLYFDTSYKIENNQLIYRSGYLRGKIEISNITEIQKDKTMWLGIKPALSANGIIIKYNTYDDIYIAPYDNDEMISDLLKVNANIKITV
ncbi:PH domain-containing protein [Aestuariibaculum suncheonense]|uniref:PH domain-containing protein n=2 Tax=Aestuariibaculum suncheonense TaxID=1028745 RepID=A0A8J6Q698_9FLAO|nr:PH domain-containing protein [Aestuariibaculum suncheonense]MBD0835147.1 PH domain-containing protein [Aestuariibaculum suncheonense]